MRGQPFVARLTGGLFKPRNVILGVDVASRIVAVGRNVRRFKPGDEVFGDLAFCGAGGSGEPAGDEPEDGAEEGVRKTKTEKGMVP